MKAFPTLADNGHAQTQDGMDLRDYFAVRLMPYLLSADIPGEDVWQIAEEAYAIADAMIEVRGAK